MKKFTAKFTGSDEKEMWSVDTAEQVDQMMANMMADFGITITYTVVSFDMCPACNNTQWMVLVDDWGNFIDDEECTLCVG